MPKAAIAREQSLISYDELKLAWHRIRADRPSRCFVVHPQIFDWIEPDLRNWLRKLQRRLRDGYVPAACGTCYSPKAGWMVRPGGLLDLEDEVVFNALLGRFHAEIWAAIGWAKATPM
jgi:hypothetical protein